MDDQERNAIAKNIYSWIMVSIALGVLIGWFFTSLSYHREIQDLNTNLTHCQNIVAAQDNNVTRLTEDMRDCVGTDQLRVACRRALNNCR